MGKADVIVDGRAAAALRAMDCRHAPPCRRQGASGACGKGQAMNEAGDDFPVTDEVDRIFFNRIEKRGIGLDHKAMVYICRYLQYRDLREEHKRCMERAAVYINLVRAGSGNPDAVNLLVDFHASELAKSGECVAKMAMLKARMGSLL